MADAAPAPATRAAPAPQPASPAAPVVPAPLVRVDAPRLDALVGASSRLSLAVGREALLPPELRALHERVAALAASGRRLRRQLARKGDTLPPAVAARLHELDDALRDLARDAGRLADEATVGARALGVACDEVASRVRELRLRPLADAVEPLARVVRDLAAATGKSVRLETTGTELEADRTVLDAIRDALLHVVRNAIDHGIEAPEARAARGKPPQGTIRIAAALLGDRLLVQVTDDGTGLDVAGVRTALARRGDEIPEDDHAVARLLFHGGLSTRDEAGAISGRGVGLDAVRAALARVRGSADVRWSAGTGTTFLLEAPITLATIRALLVAVGRHRVALPTAWVERLLLVRPDDVQVVDGREAIATAGSPAPLASLAELLGPPLVAHESAGTALPVVLLRLGDRRLAVAVDAFVGEQEVAVRPVTGLGRALPQVSGAVLLPDGEVALVLDATALVGRASGQRAGTSAPSRERARATRRRVLVVDDSITTRTLEQSVLEAAGYDVATAVDGADGWRLLQERGADLVVSDVEMPRMDGFALCATIRASRRFAELPVVLVTALESAEDRSRGLEAGADAYLGKSSFEQATLLDTVRELIGEADAARRDASGPAEGVA